MAIAALVTLIAGGLDFLRVWPPFAVVMSGSMAPTINTGDMVILQRLHAPAHIGEVVVVPVPDDARSRYGYPPVVIHRVFRITNGQIRTKGDARPAADPFTVPRTAVDARVIAHIPAGGRVLAFFHSAPGLAWLLFGGVLLFGLPLLDRARDARAREAEATTGLHDTLATVAADLLRLQAEQERSRQTADETREQIDRLARLVAQALDPDRANDAGTATASPSASDAFAAAPEAAQAMPGSGVSPGVAATAAQPVAESGSVVKPTAAPAARSATIATAPAAGSDAGLGSAQAIVSSLMSTASCDPPARSHATAPSPAAVARVATLAGIPAPVAVAGRWDAPPVVSSPNGHGWAGPPPLVRSERFQRPGRLVAASLLQASPAA